MKPTDVKKITLTRNEWSKIIASLDINKRELYADVLKKIDDQLDGKTK